MAGGDKISDLKVGQQVEVYDHPLRFKGYVGEIHARGTVYVWQNTHNGAEGNISPRSKGYKYGWAIGTGHSKSTKVKILKRKERTMTKYIWEVIVIDKEKDEILVKEIIIDGEEKQVTAKAGIRFADKLKNLVFDNLYFITRQLGTYEKKEKK